uniref:Uncharacterized protein n=1 Tax=Haptolina brevifila TaxID=156173 RepID=A0A7S2MY16_9EUKA|mmetsp:Transcript_61549/g.121748  ORF Transcript_61549/g.121748 Transcript_61549/m.121748 type:complete len:107 (+) Transcript_61549:141-461(+)
MLYATIDIYDDTVRRTDERSDAYQYAALWPCCFPKCVGAVWLLLSVAIFGSSIFAVIWIVRDSTTPLSWSAFLAGPLVLLLALIFQFLIPCFCKGGSGKESKPLLG